MRCVFPRLDRCRKIAQQHEEVSKEVTEYCTPDITCPLDDEAKSQAHQKREKCQQRGS